MKFDINETMSDMLKAIKGLVSDDWDDVKSTANEFLNRKKDRLQRLAELRISGELSQEKFESRLKDEKSITEAELHAVAVISKALAQKAANAVIGVLQKAVKAAL